MKSLVIRENFWRSDAMREGVLERWLVRDGDDVRCGATICHLRIDDRLVVMTAPESGRIMQFARDGETVEPGRLIGCVTSR